MTLPFDADTIDSFLSEPRACVRTAAQGMGGDALVLGAAGKMGLHVCLMLQRAFERNGQPHRVLAVSRFTAPGSRDTFERYGIRTLRADLCRPTDLAALPDAGAVWFLAGIKFGSADRPEVLHQFNVEMPRAVAARFRESRMAVLSTGCVYPYVSPDIGGSRETDPPGPVGAYAESCLGREAAFREAAEAGGSRAVILRLNYAVEPRYGVLVDIALRVRNGEPLDLATGFVNCIWQGDAVAHVLAAIDLAARPAATLNIAGPDILPVRRTAEAFGRRFERAPVFRGREEPTAWLSDARRAIGLFGPPEIGPEKMISWTAEWLRRGGPTLGKPTKFEVRSGHF